MRIQLLPAGTSVGGGAVASVFIHCEKYSGRDSHE